MRSTGIFVPLVAATFVAGCVMSVVVGQFGHWIPILMALGVVLTLARSAGR